MQLYVLGGGQYIGREYNFGPVLADAFLYAGPPLASFRVGGTEY